MRCRNLDAMCCKTILTLEMIHWVSVLLLCIVCVVKVQMRRLSYGQFCGINCVTAYFTNYLHFQNYKPACWLTGFARPKCTCRCYQFSLQRWLYNYNYISKGGNILVIEDAGLTKYTQGKYQVPKHRNFLMHTNFLFALMAQCSICSQGHTYKIQQDKTWVTIRDIIKSSRNSENSSDLNLANLPVFLHTDWLFSIQLLFVVEVPLCLIVQATAFLLCVKVIKYRNVEKVTGR